MTGTEDEGLAWSKRRLGDAGLSVRARIPGILRDSHNRLAEAQAASEMTGHQVYGNVWLKVYHELVGELGTLPGAHIVRVPSAPYDLIAFGETVLFPWRYAREAAVDPVETPMGHVSDTRRQIFDGFAADPQMTLPYSLEDPGSKSESSSQEPAEAQEPATNEGVVRALVADGHKVVVIAYASNADSLLRIEWGDAELVAEGLPLNWDFHELLTLAPAVTSRPRLTVVPNVEEEPTFASGPLDEPDLVARPGAAETPEAAPDEVPFGGTAGDEQSPDEQAPRP